jgi:hypothetical protein
VAVEGDGVQALGPVQRGERQVSAALEGLPPQDFPREQDPGLEFPDRVSEIREDGGEHSEEHHGPRRR